MKQREVRVDAKILTYVINLPSGGVTQQFESSEPEDTGVYYDILESLALHLMKEEPPHKTSTIPSSSKAGPSPTNPQPLFNPKVSQVKSVVSSFPLGKNKAVVGNSVSQGSGVNEIVTQGIIAQPGPR